MRLLDTEVKYFDRDTYKIPEYGNTWGCIVDYLDTCLVNGTEGQEVLSITTTDDPDYPGKYWLSKIMLNPGHGFKENLSVIEITECSEPVYNGVHRVQEVGEDYIYVALETVNIPEQPKDVTFTTGMSINQPPLGFEKPYSAPQKAVYKVTTKEGKYCYLRVDNSCPEGYEPSWVKFARVSMFEKLSQIEDFKYTPGSKKAPCYVDQPNPEENLNSLWFSTATRDDDGVKLNGSYRRNADKATLFGDKTFFYIHIRDLLFGRTTKFADKDGFYFFGEYNKRIYKEDPLPFILRSTINMKPDTPYMPSSSSYSHFLAGYSNDNHTFSCKSKKLYGALPSEGVHSSQWYPYSGANSSFPLNYYHRELNIDTIQLPFIVFRDGVRTLEGYFPGMSYILSDLTTEGFEDILPKEFSVFNIEKEGKGFYLKIHQQNTQRNNGKADSVFFSLRGWRND